MVLYPLGQHPIAHVWEAVGEYGSSILDKIIEVVDNCSDRELLREAAFIPIRAGPGNTRETNPVTVLILVTRVTMMAGCARQVAQACKEVLDR